MPPLKGVVPPSGKVMVSAPLSVGEHDDRVVGLAHVFDFLKDEADIVVHLLHAGFVDAPVLAAGLADHVQILVRQHGRDVHARRVVPDEERLVGPPRIVAVEEVNDLGRNLLVDAFRSLQGQRTLVLACHVLGAAVGFAREHGTRRGQTDGRFWIHRTRDLGNARNWCVLARRGDGLQRWSFVDVGEAHPLHGVEVIEVAPEFLEAVRGRQRVGMVAEVVLAELAGIVAEIEQELGERRGAGPQIRRAAGELRRDHAGAQRMHAGEEGVAARRAALLGVVVGEQRAFLADLVDVRRLSDHQAAVIDARLHVADIVAHDEEDVWLALGLGECLMRRDDNCHQHHKHTEP